MFLFVSDEQDGGDLNNNKPTNSIWKHVNEMDFNKKEFQKYEIFFCLASAGSVHEIHTLCKCQNASEKAHGFSDARIRENLNGTIVYFLCRLFGRKSNKKSKCDRRSTLKDDSHFTHSKGPHVSVYRQNFVLVLTSVSFPIS